MSSILVNLLYPIGRKLMKPLIIGDLIIKTPVIQGGMGIGISRENLA